VPRRSLKRGCSLCARCVLLERASRASGRVTKVRRQSSALPPACSTDSVRKRATRRDDAVKVRTVESRPPDPLMGELPSSGAELLDGVVGQHRRIPDVDVDNRHRDKRAVARRAKSSITEASDASPNLSPCGRTQPGRPGGPARTKYVNDDYRVVDMHPAGTESTSASREERRQGRSKLRRRDALLSRSPNSLGHPVENLRAPGIRRRILARTTPAARRQGTTRMRPTPSTTHG